MKALVKRTWKPGFHFEDVVMPQPKAGEVRLEVIGSAICGSDLHIYESAPGYEWLTLPMTPGHELVGRVEVLSEGVSGTGWESEWLSIHTCRVAVASSV